MGGGGGSQGKRESLPSPKGKRESLPSPKGKRENPRTTFEAHFHLTITARTHARTKRNDFPVGPLRSSSQPAIIFVFFDDFAEHERCYIDSSWSYRRLGGLSPCGCSFSNNGVPESKVGGPEHFVQTQPGNRFVSFVRACVRAGEARRSCVGEREAMRSV